VHRKSSTYPLWFLKKRGFRRVRTFIPNFLADILERPIKQAGLVREESLAHFTITRRPLLCIAAAITQLRCHSPIIGPSSLESYNVRSTSCWPQQPVLRRSLHQNTKNTIADNTGVSSPSTVRSLPTDEASAIQYLPAKHSPLIG
jgi:hypothetical protein